VTSEPLSVSVSQVRDAIAALSRSPILIHSQIIRPNNTKSYTANDVICGRDTESGILFTGDAEGTKIIVSARLVDRANQASKLSADLWLFSKPLTNPIVDNMPFDPHLDDMDNFIEVISFVSSDAIALGNVTIYRIAPPRSVATFSSPIYGVLVATGAYIPVLAEKIDIYLGLLPQDSTIS